MSYDELSITLEAARAYLLRQQSQITEPPDEPKRVTSWWKRR